MKKFLTHSSILSVGLLTPFLIFAQGAAPTAEGLIGLLNQIQRVINATIPVLIGLAVLAFSWGIVKYLFSPDKEGGKKIMLWGIIAIFVMTSVWGLVGILRGTILPSSQDVYRSISVPEVSR